MLNFRQYQRNTILQALRLQTPGTNQTNISYSQSILPGQQQSTPQWKVLIYDQYCRDIISPLFTVPQLRSENITLHLLLNSPRDPIRGTNVIYILRPTDDNITMLINDINNDLYDLMYINWTVLSDHFLEHFTFRLVNEVKINGSLLSAANAAASSSQQQEKNSSQVYTLLQQKIKQVKNLLCDYITVEDNLITLQNNMSYLLMYSKYLNESNITNYINNKIILSLISLIYQVYINNAHYNNSSNTTTYYLPYILLEQHKTYTPSYVIARLLIKKLSQTITLPASTASSATIGQLSNVSFKYYKLYLFDRQQNIPLLLSQFLQNIQYIALINDYGYRYGKCCLPVDTTASGNQNQSPEFISIDNNDPFWYYNRFKILPDVAETVHKTLFDYKGEINRVQQIIDKQNNMQSGSVGTSNQTFSKVIATLPKLLKKKSDLESHTKICVSLVTSVGHRQLHKLYPILVAAIRSVYENPITNLQLLQNYQQQQVSNLNQTLSHNTQVQLPTPLNELLTFFHTAQTNAVQTQQSPQNTSPNASSTIHLAGSLSPIDRLIVVCVLIILGFDIKLNDGNNYIAKHVNILKQTMTDTRYFKTFFIPSTQYIDNIVSYFMQLQPTLQMSLQQQNNKISQHLASSAAGGQPGNTNAGFSNIYAGISGIINAAAGGGDADAFLPLIHIIKNTHLLINNKQQQNQQQSSALQKNLVLSLLCLDTAKALNTPNQPQQGNDQQLFDKCVIQNPSSALLTPYVNPQQQNNNQTQLESFVFIIGSGNYTEYSQLCGDSSNNMLYASPNTADGVGGDSTVLMTNNVLTNTSKSGLSGVVYGSTEMLNCKQFLDTVNIMMHEDNKSSNGQLGDSLHSMVINPITGQQQVFDTLLQQTIKDSQQ